MMTSDIDNKVKVVVEGLLLAAGRPLSLDTIAGVFSADERPDAKELRQVMEAIGRDCEGRGFLLREVASGFRFQVRAELSEWVAKLWEERPPRYSRALLETLAIIAYRQPLTRGDIEDIRGVAVSTGIIRTLLDREWVRVVGHRNLPGKPAMFATTKRFLDYFDLQSLQELPPLAEIQELGKPEQVVSLEEELARQRLTAAPDDEAAAAGSADDLADASADVAEAAAEPVAADAMAEEEAIALAARPLDDILGIDRPDDEARTPAGTPGLAARGAAAAEGASRSTADRKPGASRAGNEGSEGGGGDGGEGRDGKGSDLADGSASADDHGSGGANDLGNDFGNDPGEGERAPAGDPAGEEVHGGGANDLGDDHGNDFGNDPGERGRAPAGDPAGEEVHGGGGANDLGDDHGNDFGNDPGEGERAPAGDPAGEEVHGGGGANDLGDDHGNDFGNDPGEGAGRAAAGGAASAGTGGDGRH